MSDTVLPAEPWYTSKVYIGACVSILSQLGTFLPAVFSSLGLSSPDAINSAVSAIFQTIALAAGIYTATARAKSTVAPLTLNAASAAAHPNTVASSAAPPPADQPTI